MPSAVAVGWSTSDGTATAGDDYLAVSSTVRFAADSTASQTLTVSTLTDTLAEAEETFTVTLTAPDLPAGVSLGTAEATATITDDAAAATGVALQVAPSTVPEGTGATEVTVTATLNGAARSSATAVSVSGDSASTDDFAAVSDFALTIPANGQEGTATFTLTPTDDAEAEGPETVSVTGTTDVPGLTVTAAELTITDDDTAAGGVTLSVEPSVVDEDAGATVVTVTATLGGGVLSEAVIVAVTVAEDPEEYAVAPAAVRRGDCGRHNQRRGHVRVDSGRRR